MEILASRRMKKLIIIVGLAILSCAEMETANNRNRQRYVMTMFFMNLDYSYFLAQSWENAPF